MGLQFKNLSEKGSDLVEEFLVDPVRVALDVPSSSCWRCFVGEIKVFVPVLVQVLQNFPVQVGKVVYSDAQASTSVSYTHLTLPTIYSV